MITLEEMVAKYGWADNETNRKRIEEINNKESEFLDNLGKMVDDIRAKARRKKLDEQHKKNDKIGLKRS